MLLGLMILNGAEGQNRTVDTTIFSRMLYQLSYFGTAGLNRKERTTSIFHVRQ